MPKYKLPSGVVVEAEDGLDQDQLFRRFVAADPSLQKQFGVKQNTSGLQDLGTRVIAGAKETAAGLTHGLGRFMEKLTDRDDDLGVGQYGDVAALDGTPDPKAGLGLSEKLSNSAARTRLRLSQPAAVAATRKGLAQANLNNVVGTIAESAPSLGASVVGGLLLGPAGGMGTEAAIASSQNAQQTQSLIANALRQNPSLIGQTPKGREAMHLAGGNVEVAIEILSKNSSDMAGYLTMLTTPAMSKLTGDFGGKLLSGQITNGLVGAGARGIVQEGIEEAGQSAAEAFNSNLAQRSAGMPTPLHQNLGEAAVMGGLTGAVAGGTLGAGVGAVNDGQRAVDNFRVITAMEDLADYRSQVESIRAQQAQAAMGEFGLGNGQPGPTPEQQAFLDQRGAEVRARLQPIFEKALGPKASLATVNTIVGPGVTEGVAEPQAGGNVLVNLATALHSQKADPEAAVKDVVGVGNHEILHAAKELGIITPEHEAVMVDKAKKVRFVGPDGKTRKFTFWENAAEKYGKFDEKTKSLTNEELVNEEAIAELARYQQSLDKPNLATYRTFSDNIKNFYRSLTGAIDEASQVQSGLMSGQLRQQQEFQGLSLELDQIEREAQAKAAGDPAAVQPDVQAGPVAAEEPPAPAPTPQEPTAQDPPVEGDEFGSLLGGLENATPDEETGPKDADFGGLLGELDQDKPKKFSYIPLIEQAKKLGIDTQSIPELRKLQEMNAFHSDLMGQVQARARLMQEVANKYHERGQLPFQPGTRFTTEFGRRNGQAPWEVTGYYVDPHNPEKYGYRVQRGQPDVDQESTVLYANDPMRPAIAELASKYQPLTGPRKFSTIQAKPGANLGRMAKLLGSKLYGDERDLPNVSIKEVMQNSFDAIKGMIEKGQLTKGKIEIDVNRALRVITIKDNGSGMKPQTLATTFLEIAGTHKETERASGGLGIAKMLFLFGNKRLRVKTLRDGVMSTMVTTGEDLRAAMSGEDSRAPEVVTEKAWLPSDLFPDGHGTIVEITIPETYIDASSGEERRIDMPWGADSIETLRYSPLFANIDVTYNGNKVEDIGSDFPKEKYTTFAEAKFDWGTARIYASHENEDRYGENTHVLSNGLWQFSTNLKKDTFGPNIQHRFYIDVNSRVAPEEPGYPFDLNRQQFSAKAKKDFESIFKYMQVFYNQRDFESEAKSWGSAEYLSYENGKLLRSSATDLSPDYIPKGPVAALSEGDKVEVVDGVLKVNGREVPTLTADDLKNAAIDVSDLKIDQSKIESNKVMLHDNVEVLDRTTNSWVPLTTWGRREYGDRFDQYVFAVGEAFRLLRKKVVDEMDPHFSYRGYSDLLNEAVGVSFDPEYRGVSIKVPFSGMFINPAVPEYTDPVKAAYGMIGTMVHEMAHYKVRSHNHEFPAEMQRILIHLSAAKDFDYAKFQRNFVSLIERYDDVLRGLNDKILNASDARIAGNRFKDGQYEAGASGDGRGVAGPGQERGGERGVSERASARTGAAGGKPGSSDVRGKGGLNGLPVPPNERFSFIGIKEEGGIIPTDALIKFVKDEARGRSPKSLYKETGIWRQKDGKLRYELSDYNAWVPPQFPGYGIYQLPDILKFDELYAAYPVLRNIQVNLDPTLEGQSLLGGFRRDEGLLTLNPDIWDAEWLTTSGLGHDNGPKGVMLHEIQHVIQAIEGMTGGFSPSRVRGDHAMNQKAYVLFHELTGIDVDPKMSKGQFFKKYWPLWSMEAELPNKLYAISKIPNRDRRMLAVEILPAAEHSAALRMADTLVYRSVLGEIEARHVQSRMSLPDEVRREISPLRNEEYEGGIVLPPFDQEEPAWTAQRKKFSFIGDTVNTPNTEPALTDDEVPDPEDYGPAIGMIGTPTEQAALGRELAMQSAALAGPAKILLSPAGLRLGGKMGVRWDKGFVEDLRDRAITNIQSETWPLKQFLVRALQMGAVITDRSDPVAMQALFHGRVYSRLNSALNNLYKPLAHAIADIKGTDTHINALANSGSELAEAMKLVEGVTPSAKLLELFLYARHAPERNAFIERVRQSPKIDPDTKVALDEINKEGSGMSNAEAKLIMDWFENSDLLPKIQAATTIADAIVKSTNRIRERAGLIPVWDDVISRNPDAAWVIPNFQYYVPLRGVNLGAVDEEADTPLSDYMNKGSGYSTRGREDQRMKGRNSYAGTLVENLMRQHEHAIVRGQKNQIGQSFLRFIRDNAALTGMSDLFIVNPAPKKVPVIDHRTGKVHLATDPNWKNDPTVFIVKEDGVEIPIVIKDPEILKSLKEMSTLGEGGLSSLLRFVRPVTNLMSRFATSWNPEFAISNPIRDVQEGTIRGSASLGKKAIKIGPRMIKYAGMLVKERATGGGPATDLFSRMEKLGAFTGVYGLKGVEETVAHLQSEIRHASWETMTTADKALVGLRRIADIASGVNDLMEAATRMAVFQTAIDRGFTEFRAAQLAKTTTINFNERGRWGPALGALYMLSNARIQGQANFLSGLSSGVVRKAVSGMIIAGFLQELWNDLAGGDDDENPYEKLMTQQPYVAKANWVFIIPGSDQFLQLPKPPGFGLFQDMGRFSYRSMTGKMNPVKATLTLLGNFAEGFNITGATNIAGIVPSMARAPFEAAINKNWTGQAIHPTALPFGVQPSNASQHFANTPSWAVWIADKLSKSSGGEGDYLPGKIDIHPDTLDHVITSYFAGTYSTMERMGRLAAKAFGEKELPGQRESTINDVPFARKFVGTVTDVTSQKFFNTYIDDYVRLSKEQDRLAEADPDALESYERKHERELAIAPVAVAYAEDIVKLNRDAREIREDRQLPDTEKIPLLKEIKQNQQDLMKEGLAEIKALEREIGIHREPGG